MQANNSKTFLGMPQGFGSLFFTQIFSTISFAVMYATLVLYMQTQLHFSSARADLVTGVYFACNFALHLLSGYIGGRFFSFRGLVVTGIIFQLIACVILSHGSIAALYWGLSCMLVGTGTMVTCINMLVSQLFNQDDVEKRQTGFLWNYSGMNIGFIVGFSLAGYYQIHVNYAMLFTITAINNLFALGILLSRWRYMRDKKTIISQSDRKLARYLIGFLIVFVLIPVLHWLLQHTQFTDALVLTIGGVVSLMLMVVGLRNHGAARKKVFAFIILLLSAQIFWIVYQLAPMGLTLFAKNNVDRHVFGLLIAPAWIQNINSVTIIVGAPLLGVFFAWLRSKTTVKLLPLQYSSGLILSGLGLLILPIGIALGHHGYTAFSWLFFTYVMQALAELLISPIGYSMVGQLIPVRWQSFCMGTILLNSGVAAVLASFLSNVALGKSGSVNPLVTNPSYSHMFSLLGWLTLGVGVFLLLLRPLLNRLISA